MPRWPWQRTAEPQQTQTRPPVEERLGETEALLEALTQRVAQQQTTGARLTYPTGDPATEAALKRADMSNRSRKVTLLETYLGESWISACVDAIAGRLISGGWVLEPTDAKHADEATREPLLELLNWCNQDEDFNQILSSMATDLGIFGETYLEVTWKRSPTLKRDVPFELYTVDCISMDYVLAPDNKGIGGFVQTLDNGAPLELDPQSIIRVWLPDPRNRLKALSSIEKLLGPATLDTYIQLSEQKYFEQGNREDIAVTVKSGSASLFERFRKRFMEDNTGVKNAHKPLVLFGETSDLAVTTVGSRAQLDVLARRQFARDEMLGVFKTPPYQVGIVEHGGMGGKISDALDKQFLHAAVDPMRQRIMSTLNFRLAVQGFGVTDWVLDAKYADFRDTQDMEQIRDLQIKGGRRTINEIRAEEGREALPGGDVAVIVTSRDVVPLRELPDLVSLQKQAAEHAAVGAPLAPAIPAAPEKDPDQDKDQAESGGQVTLREGAGAGLPGWLAELVAEQTRAVGAWDAGVTGQVSRSVGRDG